MNFLMVIHFVRKGVLYFSTPAVNRRPKNDNMGTVTNNKFRESKKKLKN